MTWDDFFMSLARQAATKSKDRSTQVGSVIVGSEQAVLSLGWNGFPRGIDDNVDERHERPNKYLWTEHAERNAIYNASRIGAPVVGGTLYATLMPCCDCTRAIIQTGIRCVVAPEPQWGSHHAIQNNHDVSIQMLEEAGIEIRFSKDT